MNTQIKCCILFLFLIFISGCSQKQELINQHQFIYEFKVDEIVYPEKVSVFSVDRIRFSAERLEEKILQTPIRKVENTALGPTYRTESGEYLNIFDNGDGAGKKTGVDGGFNYSREISENIFPYELLGVTDAPQNKTGDLSFYNHFTFDLKNYEVPSDLTFFPKEKVLSLIRQIFQSIASYPIDLAEGLGYRLSFEKMTEQIQSSNIQAEFFRMPQKDDEAYLFLFQQTIEGIPIVNQHWEKRTADEKFPHLSPGVLAIYKETGIAEINAKNLVTIRQKLGETSIISPEEVLKSFEQQPLLADQVIESCHLKYVIIQGKKTLKLIPVWQLTTRQEKKYEQENHPTFVYPEYQTLLYDAGTGERIMEGIEE
ncbi:hypothetical protein ACYSNO_08030 [Enterococcus sp. LJL98]